MKVWLHYMLKKNLIKMKEQKTNVFENTTDMGYHDTRPFRFNPSADWQREE